MALQPEHPAGERAVRRDRHLPLLAPALLVVVALVQIGLAFGVGLSPWKGGGYGMFATTDRGSLRSLRVVAVGPVGERVLRFPSWLDHQRREAREIPTQGRLLALARELADEAPESTALRVEVWRTVFARGDLRPHRELLADAVHELPAKPARGSAP